MATDRNIGTSEQGFTLVEMIFVIVILGIVTSIGASFVVSAVDSYRTAEIRNKLIHRGRLSIEQITREARRAAPNSIRISASGNCFESLPVVGNSNYQGSLPDQNNSVSAVSAISTGSFTLDLGSAQQVIVGAISASEIYTSSTTASRVAVASLGSSPYTSVPLGSSHRFNRNSPNRRIFITDNPIRYCLNGGHLYRYSAYGFLTTSLTDADPGGVSDLVSHNVTTNSIAFQLSTGAEDRNVSVLMDLVFSNEGISVDLNHQVLVRNVP